MKVFPLPREVEVLIEVTQGQRVKRRADGRIDFVSPWRSPFNYGSVPDTLSTDGDPLDAIVLGPPLPIGSRDHWPVVALIDFIDAGLQDPKLVCSPSALTESEQDALVAFFRMYARRKTWLNRIRFKRGPTRFVSLTVSPLSSSAPSTD